MRTVTHVYEKVSIKRVKKWVDKNGKKRQMTREFMQTINPFNKNAKGQIKTYAEIFKEITKEAQVWEKLPPPKE